MFSITLTTSPTVIVAPKAPSLRGSVLIEVRKGGQDVFVSNSPAVTPSTGFALEPTASNSSTFFAENDPLSKPAAQSWYGCVASGTQEIIVMEGPP